MLTWDSFYLFATGTILLSAAGSAASLWNRRKAALWLTVAAILVMGWFIAGLWTFLSRPPLRTMGETRLWYSFFLIIAGLLTYHRWHFRWILSFTTIMAAVFCIINILKPELHDKSMMPALQSAWFVPHVTVYMFSYSILGCACLLGIAGMVTKKKDLLPSADNLVYIGIGLLSLGMLSGAVWAKQAWGDFWSWDPKETWAAATWAGYLLYIHLRLTHRSTRRILCHWLLIICFLLLQMCWYGISYLPSAKASEHVYTEIS